MSLGEITTTDLNRWQYRAISLLGSLVTAGLKAERYPLDWTITNNGSLLGQVPKFGRLSENDRRAVFEEWCRVIGAGAPREVNRFEGGTRHTAVFKHPTDRGEVHGSIVLEVDAPLDDDQE